MWGRSFRPSVTAGMHGADTDRRSAKGARRVEVDQVDALVWPELPPERDCDQLVVRPGRAGG